MKKIQRAGLAVKQKVKEGIQILKEDSGLSVIEMLLILVGILTPYYGVSIRCIE